MAVAKNSIGTDITLNGEQPVKTLAELRRSVQQVTNAWKAEGAELRSTGKIVKAAESKYKGLSQAVDKQKSLLEKLKREQSKLDTSTQSGAKQYDKLGSQIASATTKLASLQSQQDKAKKSMDYYKSGLANLQKEYKISTNSAKIYISRLQAEGNEYKASEEKSKIYKSSLVNLTRQMKIQEAELKRIENESGKTSEAYHRQADRVNQTGRSLAELKSKQGFVRNEFNKFHPTGYDKVDRSINSVKKSTSKLTSSLKKSMSGLKNLGLGLAAGFAGIGSFAIKGSEEAGSLQKILTENTNLLTTSGEKAKDVTAEVSEMQKDGRKYSVEYAESQQNIANGYQELVKRGYTGKQSLGAMRSILQASKASGDDFSDTLQVTTSTLEAFGLKTNSTSGMLKNTSKVANTLAMAADATSTGFKDLGVGMNYVGTTAKVAGISLTDTASAMGILSNSGLEAQQAGTGLRKILVSLQNPTTTGQKVLEKYGLSLDDFRTKSGKLKPIASIFKEIGDKVPKGQQANFFHNLFGTTGQNAAAILATNVDELKNVDKQVGNAYHNNYVSKLANKNMKATKKQQKQFREAIDAVKIDVGSAMMPALSKASKALTKTFEKKSTVRGLKKIAGGIGSVSIKVADFINWLGKSNNMKTVANVGKALLGAFASYKLLNSISTLKSSVSGLFSHIKRGYDNIKKLTSSGGNLEGLFKSTKSAGGFKNLTTAGKVGTVAAGAGVAIDAGSDFLQAFKNKHSADKRSQDIGKGIGSGIGGGIGLYFGGPLGAAIGSKIGSVVGKWGGEAVNKFTKGWQSKKPPKNFWSLENLGWSTHSMFDGMMSGVSSAIKWIQSKFKAMGKWLGTVGNNISKSFSGVPKILKSIGKNFSNFGKSVKRVFKTLTKNIKNAWKTITKHFSSFGKTFSKNWNNFWKTIGNFFKNRFKTIGNIFSNWGKNVQKLFSSFGKNFNKAWKNLWNGVKNIFGGVWKTIKHLAQNAMNGLIDIVNGGIDAVDGVIHSFGGAKHAIGLIGHVKFANGTDSILKNLSNPITKPVIATLNDGNDSPETGNKEMLVDSQGSIGIVQGRNTNMLLTPGMHVINAHETAMLMGLYGVKRFANGTDTIFNKIGNWAKSTAKGLKNFFTTATKIIAHPIKYLEDIFKWQDSDAIKGVMSDLSHGFFCKTSDNVKKWWTNLWNMAGDKLNDTTKHIKSSLSLLIKSQVGSGFFDFMKKLNNLFNNSEPSGTGVRRWRNQVIRALKANGLSTSTSMVNRVLRQIATESSGNQNARQMGADPDGDGSGPALGLMQTKRGTFNAYKFKDHSNIFNGYDNLLAALKYAKNRYGSSLYYLGNGHGYANGGIANQPSIFGEAGPEAAVPLIPSKSSRAWEVIGKTIAILSAQNGFGNTTDLQKQDKKDQEFKDQVLALLTKINQQNSVPVDVKLDINGREFYEQIKQYVRNDMRQSTVRARSGLSGI